MSWLRNSCSVKASTSQNLVVEIEQILARRLPLGERPDPPDDFARPLAVGDDVVERRARFGHAGGSAASQCAHAPALAIIAPMGWLTS